MLIPVTVEGLSDPMPDDWRRSLPPPTLDELEAVHRLGERYRGSPLPPDLDAAVARLVRQSVLVVGVGEGASTENTLRQSAMDHVFRVVENRHVAPGQVLLLPPGAFDSHYPIMFDEVDEADPCGDDHDWLYGGLVTPERRRAEGLSESVDTRPHDLRPNACWRCDAARATTDVGLCEPCRTALV